MEVVFNAEMDGEDRDRRRMGKSCRATKYTTVVVMAFNTVVVSTLDASISEEDWIGVVHICCHFS
jgi:hypothetical protein